MKILITLSALWFLFSSSPPSQANTISFEELTDGSPASDYYLVDKNIVFNSATVIVAGFSLNELEFPPYDGDHVAYDESGAVDIAFEIPIRSVFAFFTYIHPLQMSAFDPSGTLLGSVTSAFGNNTALSGDFGSSPNEKLGIEWDSPLIKRIRVMGSPTGASFVFDGLNFTASSFPLSEPSPILLLLGGVMAWLFLPRLRQQTNQGVGPKRFFAIVLTLLFPLLLPHNAFGNDGVERKRMERLERLEPAGQTRAAATPTDAVTIGRVETNPESIPNGLPTDVRIEAKVSGVGVIPSGVVVQLINGQGKILRTLGKLKDDGADGDNEAWDGIFTGILHLNEPIPKELRLQVSVAVKNTLLRKASEPFYITVSSEDSVPNAENDLWGSNLLGGNAVLLWFGGDLPMLAQTRTLRLWRKQHDSGVWAIIRDIEYDPDSFRLPLFDGDGIDGSLGALDYKLQLLDADGKVLKEFEPITIPQYIYDDSSDTHGAIQPSTTFASPLSATVPNLIRAFRSLPGTSIFDNLSVTASSFALPEPSSIILFLSVAIGGLVGNRPRRRNGKHAYPVCRLLAAGFALFLPLLLPQNAFCDDNIERKRLERFESAGQTRVTATPTDAVTIGRVERNPGKIPNGLPSDVRIEAKVSGAGVIPSGVVVQLINGQGKILRTLGKLKDDGADGDNEAWDGIFTGILHLNEPIPKELRLQVSVAVKNTLLRKASEPFYIKVSPDDSVPNAENDLWGGNDLGANSVSLYFGGDLPMLAQTQTLRLWRKQHDGGTWAIIRDIEYDPDSFRLPLFDGDGIDGSLGALDYKLQLLDADGKVLKEFEPITIPQYIYDDSSDTHGAVQPGTTFASPLSTAAPNPIVNTAFITDDILEDSTAMNPQQILDLLTENEALLKTNSLTENYTDTDGSSFSPAQYIYDLAQKYRINPQMILVTMQKEARLIVYKTKPKMPPDGWMGAKGCSKTFQAQLDCGVYRLRHYLDDIDTKGQTIGGWAPGKQNFTCAGKNNCSWEKLPVTPANRATAALWQYTPVVGKDWGGTKEVGGTASNIAIWYPQLFKNIVHILKWRTCDTCTTPVEVSNEGWQGWKIEMGVPDRDKNSREQAASVHGVSAKLAENPGYDVEIDCDLKTWDTYEPTNGYWDLFAIGITEGRYWDMMLTDPVPNETAPFQFGGKLDANGNTQLSTKKTQETLNLATPGDAAYLNVVLDTQTKPNADPAFPSWGTCTVKKVTPEVKFGLSGIVKAPD